MDQKSEFRILGFTTLSAITHIALVVSMLTMNLSSEPKSQALVMEFPGESAPIAETSAIPAAPAAPTATLQEVAITESVPEKIATAKTEDEIIVPQKPVEKAKAAPVAPKIAKALPKPARPAVQAKEEAQVNPEYTQEESPVALPIVQDSKMDAEPVNEELNEEEVAADLEKVEAEEAAKLAVVQAQMKKDADEAIEKQLKEQHAQAALIQKQNAEEKEKIAKAQEDRKKQEAAVVAAIAAEKAAKAKADAEARAQAAKAAAAQQAAADAAAAQAAKNSAGNGNGQATGTTAATGSGDGEVRTLADLRQMPGNSIPQYDSTDRLNQRKGDVAFMAMVSKEGTLSEIKLLKSSGHRELDAKTLKAIKSWKFFPGQEGLVEIPMKWELTGEVQAVHGGRLRSGSTTN